MTATSLRWSPSAWLNSAHVEHWLRSLWPGWRRDDVRHDWDQEGNWYWIIPDYDRGRSRVLGIPGTLFERTTLGKLQEVLEGSDWRRRIEEEGLLVKRDESGEWSVSSWSPDVKEKWFEDPEGGFFVAIQDVGPLVTTGRAPARHPTSFVALHGRDWSALGPEGTRPVESYTLEELLPYLPEARALTK